MVARELTGPTRQRRVTFFGVANAAAMWLVILGCIYPILYVAFASVSDPQAFLTNPGVLLFPRGFQTEAYRRVLSNPAILSGFRNTLIYVVAGTTLNIFMTAMGAYVLSLRGLVIRRALSKFIIFTMFFSGGLIPLFLLVRNLGMLNSPVAVIVPVAINTWNLLIMRAYFMGIPESIVESAKIDGTNDFLILMVIILPLSLPILATMVLYYGVGHWNSWFTAMIYFQDRRLYPIQLILREILIVNNLNALAGDFSAEDSILLAHVMQYAVIIVVTVPIVAIYPFLQKYFMKGILVGAVKG